MKEIVLISILFCFILLLCLILFFAGVHIGSKPKTEPKKAPEPLTDEQERAKRKREKEIKNFWDYDGTEQDKIEE